MLPDTMNQLVADMFLTRNGSARKMLANACDGRSVESALAKPALRLGCRDPCLPPMVIDSAGGVQKALTA